MFRIILDAFLIACVTYTFADLYEQWKLRKRHKAFQARCQKRLAEMYAVKRDPYDGRPV